MARPARIRRKDLKRPDEFVTTTAQALAWAQSNQRTLALVGGAVLAVMVAGGVFAAVRHARTRDANEDLARALVAYRDPKSTDAARQLSEVGQRWTGTTVGTVAQLLGVSAELRNNNAETALVVLDSAQTSGLPQYLQQQVLIGEGYALDAKGKPSEAWAKYAAASALGGPYSYTALLAEARGREAGGDPQKAKELYERIKRDFPDGPDRELIDGKLAASN